jgi:glycosyltransferase involved in cell wall biosynthesis
VVTVCDLAWQRHPATVEQPRLGYYRLFVPPSLRRAAAVLGISDATAAEVVRLYPEVAARVISTPFGTPTWVWRAAQTETAPAPPRRPRFLFVGTLEPRKNLERLLAAYALARGREASADFPGLLLVGGRGWKDSGLRRRMEELVASGHLEVRDYCDQTELWRLYRSSLALLFPSLYEGFGFPILEAMAAELPVLTADRGAMAEVAGEAGLLVDPDSTADLAAGIGRLADDARLRADLRRRGRARARDWSWERTAAATLAVYDDVLRSRPPGR